jgi:hypothetical protein
LFLRKKPKNIKSSEHPETNIKQIKEALPFWPFIFESNELKKHVKVDWDKWQDEEQDDQTNFDPNDPEQLEKMVDLMKKNGDWDGNEDEEALKMAQEEEEFKAKII